MLSGIISFLDVWAMPSLAAVPQIVKHDFSEVVRKKIKPNAKEVEPMKKITIPADLRKKTTLASNLYYDTLEIYENKVVGYLNGNQTMTWYFKEYSGIDFVKANMNSQFAQIVFLQA